MLGLVADLIEVPMQWAPLVDAALGAAAQHVVLADHRVLESLEAVEFRPAGRVGFLTLQDARDTPDPDRPSIAHLPGVLGRLDQLVHVSSEIMPVVRCLLGRAWAVEMLAHARGSAPPESAMSDWSRWPVKCWKPTVRSSPDRKR